jgi:hydroxyacylglutathione hydrolase
LLLSWRETAERDGMVAAAHRAVKRPFDSAESALLCSATVQRSGRRTGMHSDSEGEIRVIKVGPLGEFSNNAYVLVDPATDHSLIVDAPAEGERILEAAEGTQVQRIVMTHSHPDHWFSIDLLKQATGAPVFCHAADREAHADKVDATLADGDEMPLGRLKLRVIHTPGHTPGSICLLSGRHLIAGDTLFPGGPGHTSEPQQLQEEIRSILERLYVLPDDTMAYTGHGDNVTIGRSKKEYAAFASREHPPDLCGDVLWEGS